LARLGWMWQQEETSQTGASFPKDAALHTNARSYALTPLGKLPHSFCSRLYSPLALIVSLSLRLSASMDSIKSQLASLVAGIPLDPMPGPNHSVLHFQRDSSVPHAPVRVHGLTTEQKRVRSISLLCTPGAFVGEVLGEVQNCKRVRFHALQAFLTFIRLESSI
jgi:hypothetical protein